MHRVSAGRRRRSVATRVVTSVAPAAALVLLALAALLGAAPSAGAQEQPPALTLEVRSTGDRAPAVVLTNRGGATCRVASTTLGTITVVRAALDGRPIEPTTMVVSFEEAVDRTVARGLRPLDPGASVELPLRVVPLGPTGKAIETVAWAPTAASVATLHPLEDGRRLDLELSYAVPGPVPTEVGPVCPAATGSTFPVAAPPDREVAAAVAPGAADRSSAAGTAGSDRPLWKTVAIGVAAAVILVALVALLVVLFGRRRRHEVAAVLALVGLGATLTAAAATAPEARATINVDPSLQGAWAGCEAIFRGPGGDPGGILPSLDDPGVNVQIIPANGDQTHEGAISRTQIIVFWDPDDRHPYAGGGGNADPCTSLYHELYHGHEDVGGGQDHSPCVTADGPSGLPVNEVNATRVQNQLRRALGMPERTHYGDTPLPNGPCLPPDKQPQDRRCTGGGCGDSNGDPHLVTFDGRRYDFMGVGEFVATRDPAGGFEAQVRQEPLVGSRVASMNTAVAFDVDGDRVETRLGEGGRVVVLVGGRAQEVGTAAPAKLAAGGTITRAAGASAEIVTVTWPDGSDATVSPIGRWGLHLTVQPSKDRAGELEGLLGDADGDRDDDVRPRGGEPIRDVTHDTLYPTFADSWRVEDGRSLFTYEPGRGVGAYDDRSFPDREVRAEDLPGRDRAEAVCRASGVTEAGALEACIYDVALTGAPEFAAAHRATQAFLGELRLDGPEVGVRIDQPGGSARLSFEADAGTKVYLEVPSSTFGSQCGILSLRGPDDRFIDGGCIINGKGAVDGTTLDATGRYTLVVDPSDDSTGELQVRLRSARDTDRPIRPDGDEVRVRIDQPGAVARLRFTAEAGTRVFVDVPESSLPSECGVPALEGPNGSKITSGCTLDGKGTIDTTELEAGGEHAIVVDPAEDHTGFAVIRLTTVRDQRDRIEVDGDERTARIEAPGMAARFTFTARAGDRVQVDARDSTLPSACGVPVLQGPSGSSVSSGCVLSGEGGIEPVTLPDDGTYTLVVDPAERATGEVQVRVRRV